MLIEGEYKVLSLPRRRQALPTWSIAVVSGGVFVVGIGLLMLSTLIGAVFIGYVLYNLVKGYNDETARINTRKARLDER